MNRHFVQPLAAWKADSPHLKHLRALERTQFDPPDVIRERQLAAVRAIVRHAWDTVPFYRERWAAAGLHPDAVRSLDDLGRFPVLTKADIRAHGDRLRSDAYRGRPVTLKTTSGSTGVPLTIAVDEEAMAWKRACTIRSDQWSGWRFGPAGRPAVGPRRAERGSWRERAVAARSSTASAT